MIYENIKRLADEQNISIRALEIRAGLANGTISKWQNSIPTVANLQAIAKELGKPIEFFLKEET